MASYRPSRWTVFAIVLLGVHVVLSLTVGHRYVLTVFGDTLQSALPLGVAIIAVINAMRGHGSVRLFWSLFVAGSLLWFAGQFSWVYFELFARTEVPDPYLGDVVLFVHLVPFMAAIAVQPHLQHEDHSVRFGWLDFLLLLLWWVFLYVFVVIPWQYIAYNKDFYGDNFNVLYGIENIILIGGLGIQAARAHGGWRKIYLHLTGAMGLYCIASLIINIEITRGRDALGRDIYYTGSIYDVSVAAALCWAIAVTLMPRHVNLEQEPVAVDTAHHGVWPARAAMAAILSIPPLALFGMFEAGVPESVHHFRLMLALGAILLLTFLVFLKQHLLDHELMRLLRESREAFGGLQRVQGQLLHAEKLASLGQLVAGAAHEINNPLTAILGYSDLLAHHPQVGENERAMAEKIRHQARRTKALVANLLSFARQAPAEMRPVGVNTVINNAVKLRQPEMGTHMKVELQLAPDLPDVEGDENQLLQVVLHILSNAIDAVQEVDGGIVRIASSATADRVLIEFSDTGPGIKEPEKIFDPFYTTKPVGKGAGLGLSACYGIVQQHKGKISCHNSPHGGAVFVIELPALKQAAARIGD